jgi:hypothetical protein
VGHQQAPRGQVALTRILGGGGTGTHKGRSVLLFVGGKPRAYSAVVPTLILHGGAQCCALVQRSFGHTRIARDPGPERLARPDLLASLVTEVRKVLIWNIYIRLYDIRMLLFLYCTWICYNVGSLPSPPRRLERRRDFSDALLPT